MDNIINTVYCELCSSILRVGKCTNRNCINSDIKNSLRKKWKIGSDVIMFENPITYNEANKRYKLKIDNLYNLRITKRTK